MLGKPYHQESLKKRQLRRAADIIGLPEGIGWHTFRHTYRSWLDETGAPMKVQQELMRHASIQTTMNVYLTLPVGIEAKAQRTVLLVHGGPWYRDRWGFDPVVQWLANRGYAVLQVNFRGSSGYGKAFLNAGNR